MHVVVAERQRDLARDVVGALDEVGDDDDVADALAAVGAEVALQLMPLPSCRALRGLERDRSAYSRSSCCGRGRARRRRSPRSPSRSARRTSAPCRRPRSLAARPCGRAAGLRRRSRPRRRATIASPARMRARATSTLSRGSSRSRRGYDFHPDELPGGFDVLSFFAGLGVAAGTWRSVLCFDPGLPVRPPRAGMLVGALEPILEAIALRRPSGPVLVLAPSPAG